MMAESLSLEALRRRFAHLPQGLLDHLERVSRLAGQLSARWDVDPERGALVGFLHDVARAEDPASLLARARELGLAIHTVEEVAPVLLHGPLASALIEQELGLKDREMLAAITWHSTGREDMSRLEKVVFLADKLDPEKEGYYPGLEGLPALAQQDLDRAVLRYIQWQINHLLEQDGMIHPASIEAYNDLIRRTRGREAGHR